MPQGRESQLNYVEIAVCVKSEETCTIVYMYLLPTLNFTVAVGGLALLAVTVILYVDYFVFKRKYFKEIMEETAWPAIIATITPKIDNAIPYSGNNSVSFFLKAINDINACG